jgi:colicin import membrane protein
MARKLKTFQTSLGFYDLAIAAPSMKAALEAWGAGSNLFHQGVAKETDDPDVVAATMSKPGVILRRPAGSSGHFAEHSELPTSDEVEVGRSRPKTKKRQPPKISEKDARKAAQDFEREQKRHEAERRKELAAEARQRERRERAVARAQAAFDEAEREHHARAGDIEAERAAIEKRAQEEEARWEKQKKKLTAALHRARSE